MAKITVKDSNYYAEKLTFIGPIGFLVLLALLTYLIPAIWG